MLVQYARKSKNDRAPVGVLVASKVGGRVIIGWAGCHKKDIFKKEIGLKIALNRINLADSGKKIPDKIQYIMPQFLNRCMNFYKVDLNEVIVAGVI